MLLPPTDMSAGEAYIDGHIDIEGDAVAALHAATQLRTGLTTALRRRLVAALLRLPRPPHRSHARRARLHGRLHSLKRDREAIRFH